MDENNPATPQQSINLTPGTILSSDKRNYKVVAELGAGGYGVTYLAKGKIKVDNVWVEGLFAIKELFPCEFSRRVGQAVVPDPNRMTEFNRCKADFLLEAQRLQNVATNHPNIVRVNEIFEANGTAYYVMQHINGQTIYDYVGQYGALQLDYSLQLLLPIFDAIEYLHGNRINHFDIKPDNIMLQQTDEGIVPILIDFGLSIHFKKNNEKTTQKSFYGLSEGYAPVEQYAEIKAFSPASDVYSLAATLVYMVTGVAPAPAPALKVSDLRQQLQPLLPPQAVDAICHAMAKQDDERTQSVAQFRAELTGTPAPQDAPAAPQQAPAPSPASQQAPAPSPASQQTPAKPAEEPKISEPKRQQTVGFDAATVAIAGAASIPTPGAAPSQPQSAPGQPLQAPGQTPGSQSRGGGKATQAFPSGGGMQGAGQAPSAGAPSGPGRRTEIFDQSKVGAATSPMGGAPGMPGTPGGKPGAVGGAGNGAAKADSGSASGKRSKLWLWIVLGILLLGLIGGGVVWYLENQRPRTVVVDDEEDEEEDDSDDKEKTDDKKKSGDEDVVAGQTVTDSVAAAPVVPGRQQGDPGRQGGGRTPAAGSGSASSAGGSSASAGASSASASKVTNGTVSVPNGTYTGQLRGGKPHGKGKVRFTSEGRIASNVSDFAMPGYTMDAVYEDGVLTMGKLYDTDGNLIKTIYP